LLLLIDNYDSFVHNLARYFQRLGQETLVVRNDEIDVDGVRQLKPDAIVLSPGPCTPAEAGCCVEVVRQLHKELPMLGVCLGHQAIVAALGGRIVRAEEPMHGRTSAVEHHAQRLFAGVPSPLIACRYHSLVAERDSLPAELSVCATTADGTIMAVEHVEFPLFGVQFHPEAILSEQGYPLLANFLRVSGCSVNVDVQHLAESERRVAPVTMPVVKLRRPIPY
jgi:anthranilate synthase/aminodeoxychorismate synthase-like glutamine amidotransferase